MKIEIGNWVKKKSGDYEFRGRVVSVFSKLSGKLRYVVENRDGILHIFSDQNLELIYEDPLSSPSV